jgi:GNAT superfamily N-acetyltransferase
LLIDPHPLTTPSPDDAAGWHAVLVAALAQDSPAATAPTSAETAARLAARDPTLRTYRWLVRDADGSPAGVAAVQLPVDPASDRPGDLDLHVHPARRRTGAGSRLVAVAIETARAAGTRGLIAEVATGTGGEAFATAHGFRRGLALTWLRLRLADAVTPAGADDPRPGYHLRHWDGVAPDELIDTLARAKSAMADMPVGGLDLGAFRWDAARIRRASEAIARRGDLLHTVAAVADDSGEIAGYTELVVRAAPDRPAQQYDTVVVPAHRGRGLGIWLKARMLVLARERHPLLTEIEADNADDNAHMLDINTRLGFRPVRRTALYQLDLHAAGSDPA